MRLRQWPIDRARRKRRPPHSPLVLVDRTQTRLTVAHACPQAFAGGASPGMTLAEALATCPGLTHADHAPRQDLQSLHRLACWMVRFSPAVAVEPPDALLLDITGSKRLFGGYDRLLARVADALGKLRLAHQAAIAPTPGAAWAMASFFPESQDCERVKGSAANAPLPHGRGSFILINPAELSTLLAPLPVESLRLPKDVIQTLHAVGVRQVNELMSLPRSALPSRFGASVLTRLDQALGHAPEPLVPVRSRQAVAAELELEYAITSLEQLWEVLARLVHEVSQELRRRGQGAKKIRLDLRSDDKTSVHREILFSEPTANPATLFNLLRCASEEMKCDIGFVKIMLAVPISEPLATEQFELLEHESRIAEKDFAHLVDRLKLRLGNDSVCTPRLVACHLPERAFGLAEVTLNRPGRAKLAGESSPSKARPLHLLALPSEVHCMTSPTSDGGGLPLSFTHQGRSYRIVQARGPERIAGMWWEGRNKTRDYFDVEESTGRRFWIFRVAETRKWYLHGIFDC